ncbi:MAG: hypothetical protein NVS4B8_05750 [Herpetosiphon sp.]
MSISLLAAIIAHGITAADLVIGIVLDALWPGLTDQRVLPGTNSGRSGIDWTERPIVRDRHA